MPNSRWVIGDENGYLEQPVQKLCKAICERFGYGAIMPWQASAMQAVVQGKDVVVSSGTGSGKSLVFQGLTLLKENAIVLVISPLISIMEDQVIDFTPSRTDNRYKR